MATVFNTQVGNGKYCLQFETDNKEHYMLMQSLVRLCMDRTNIRLIDADSLHRKVMMETNPYGKPTIDYDSGVKVLEWIEQAPTIDAVEVVRCKDCKYFKTLLCQNEDNHENWFCADGERK